MLTTVVYFALLGISIGCAIYLTVLWIRTKKKIKQLIFWYSLMEWERTSLSIKDFVYRYSSLLKREGFKVDENKIWDEALNMMQRVREWGRS